LKGESNGGSGQSPAGISGQRRETIDGWDPPSVREGKGPGYRFGFPARLGRGPLLKLGRMASPGPFTLFRNLFLFLFYQFFNNFCKYVSIQAKLFSLILQNSQQGFKPTSNMFLEPKQDF
jgi:hypothetical protein